jgi:probable phosphoglycerate mutase
MTRLILVRHGNTFEKEEVPVQVGARSDLPLTATGREQLKKLGAFFKEQKEAPIAIFTGFLKRQAESAKIIAENFGVKVEKTPVLSEIDYGPWEGLTQDEISRKWPKEFGEWNLNAKWQPAIFGGAFEEHWQSLMFWFERIFAEYPDQTVVGITSNGLLRLLRNEKVKTGHFCTLELSYKNWKILDWNKSSL